MPDFQNFVAFHQSLGEEFQVGKDQIRNLIGDAHWPSDGGHKEAILRRLLQNKLPECFRVGTGFFSNTSGCSTQIDVLITDANKPTLFRNGDFFIVTPDCVKAIIEVKTGLTSAEDIEQTLNTLADNLQVIRRYNPDCWAGLFEYEGPELEDPAFERKCKSRSRRRLQLVSQAAQNQLGRAINCLSLGANTFIRYWPRIPQPFFGRLHQTGWQSYIFNNQRHRSLAPAYFIGNLVMHLTSSEGSDAGLAWFPIQDGNGKEDYCVDFIELGQRQINIHG